MKSQIRNNSGFTLVEILIVITILALLALLTMLAFQNVPRKARDSKRKADLEQIRGALEHYQADVRGYPANIPSCGGQIRNGTNVYLAKIPCDPVTNNSYTYSRDGTNVFLYSLGTATEEPAAGNNCNLGGCGGTCNYCVTNP